MYRLYIRAAILAISNLNLIFKGSPKTLLRLITIMGFDFGANLYGLSTNKEQAYNAAITIDLVALINSYYDGKGFDIEQYKKNRAKIKLTEKQSRALCEYRAYLKFTSKTRSNHWRTLINNREEEMSRIVNLFCALFDLPAFDKNSSHVGINQYVKALYNIGFLCQIIDDVLDISLDEDYGLPSFVQAYKKSPHCKKACLARAGRYYREVKGLESRGSKTLCVIALVCLVIIYANARFKMTARGLNKSSLNL